MFKHQCLKCKASYEDTDIDPYYCEACKSDRRRIAEEIDAKLAGRVSEKTESGLKRYDRLLNEARANGGRFPSIHDLGISL